MNIHEQIENIIASRGRMITQFPPPADHAQAAEGGCGVVGLASSFPVAGRHLIPAAQQMHNRGNGKGGGIAAAGLSAKQMGVTSEILQNATLLQVAFLDPSAQPEVEAACIQPYFEILHSSRVPTLDDYRQVAGLEVQPPDVWRYFVRAKADVLQSFAAENDLQALDPRQLEDEFVYQNTFRLNQRFYASLGEQRAFVLSHGRDLLVFKIVGYAEQAALYYKLEDLEARVWIAHQRYPTKGRVWHPGGAHPFIGLNEALVHNGDFANYHAVGTYLRQRNIVPLFLTDTEISVLLFDLYDRMYGYPLEATIEALAPTTERDFAKLPPEKRDLYRAVQAAHLHASPDGPWFFIIARSQPDAGMCQLLGITDTSMLRPQVFALSETSQNGQDMQIGLVASEKQAIDATLQSIHSEIPQLPPVADRYWNARGGSHTDGGAFSFTVNKTDDGQHKLTCSDKFGHPVVLEQTQQQFDPQIHKGNGRVPEAALLESVPLYSSSTSVGDWLSMDGTVETSRTIAGKMKSWKYEELVTACSHWVETAAQSEDTRLYTLALITRLRDQSYDTGRKRRASVLSLLDAALQDILNAVPLLTDGKTGRINRIDWSSREQLQPPTDPKGILVVDISGFPPEGDENAGIFLALAVEKGWHHLITFNWRGQRFAGCGLSANSKGVRMDVYGSSGDYLGSGLDGAEIYVHDSAQDQVGQIFNAGRIVIHGDTGQTFMYGAKGGEAYVRGNAAGRPLINAVGSPRVVINGTCLDYLAESFMAGDPLNGGGFVILNGLTFDAHGRMTDLHEPYPGGNLFSLASGGAIYLRDPYSKTTDDQLNGGSFCPLTDADWELIQPYLEENERLFGIPVEGLLTIDGKLRTPQEVYRKVAPAHLSVLT
jgi:glutamate synthase domain-containing protein 1/glutamate synthase domain-containing protein 3